MTQGYITQNCR